MAPVPEAYFPSLDKCFSGDAQLLSWKRAFLYASDPEGHADDDGHFSAFLSHPESIQLLSQSLNPFSRPSAKTKADFESKTAAIHVETKSKGSFDLEEVKADTQWLSQKAEIDEIAALRIAVLEWQTRPAARLAASFSDEETSSLQSAAGADNLRVSVAGPNLASILRPAMDSTASSFNDTTNRRLRICDVYISERSHIVKISRKLLALSQYDASSEQKLSTPGNGQNSSLCELGKTLFQEKSTSDALAKFLEECILAIRSRLTDLAADDGWLSAEEANEETSKIWRTSLVEEIVHILQMMFHQLRASADVTSGELLASWLELMAEYNFLAELQVPCQEPVGLLLPLQAFIILTTLAFLNLPVVIPAILHHKQPTTIPSKQAAYFLSKDKMSQITEILLNSSGTVPVADPAVFSWGLVLHTMRQLVLVDKQNREWEQLHTAVNSFQSNTREARLAGGGDQSLYEYLLESSWTVSKPVDDTITLLTDNVMKHSTFNAIIALSRKAGSISAIDDGLTYQLARVTLLDVIRVSVNYLEYSPEIVESVLAILDGTTDSDLWGCIGSLESANDPRSIFVKDDLLMDSVYHIARSRFPYETTPFIKLCRALVSRHMISDDGLPQILEELQSMEHFTQVTSLDFQGYQTIREDENANFVALNTSLPMFETVPHNDRFPNHSNALVVSSSSELPVGTVGQVIKESKPAVITWQHQYSCLSYLGSWLEAWNENARLSSDWDVEAGAEIIGLLADLIANSKDHNPREYGVAAKQILEMASDGLRRQGDIISVVLDIFERNLQNIGSGDNAAQSLVPVIACLPFIQEALRILPGRVWPFLSRSSLIGSDGKGGVMTAIISAMEMSSGDYPFLLQCVGLLEDAVNDAASRAALRKNPFTDKSKSSYLAESSAGIPSHIMRRILLNATRIMVDIYNSNANWRFNLPEQKFKLNTTLATTFDRILYYAYGVNDTAKLETKITGVFSDAAVYILDMLRPRSTPDLPFNPVFRLISDGLQTPPTLHLRHLGLIERQVNSTLELCIRLVQAAHLAQKPGSLLEEQLFKTTPVLVKLYALHDSYRLPVLSLLDILISNAASNQDSEPPSVVGHLGPESTCMFLDVLSQLDKPIGDKSLLIAIWQLLSTFVSKRQQWVAVFVLKGTSPRQALKNSNSPSEPKLRGAPFLQMALDRLANIENEDPEIALSLLEFISRAQENWPWVTPKLKSHPMFLTGIVNYVSKLQMPSSVPDQIFLTRIAAVVADICAVYLHSAKEANDWGFFKTLIPLVQWYAKDAVEVSGYNASLHANLKQNFEEKYKGCSLLDFKKTSLETRAPGKNYCYDLDLGHKLLSFDFSWSGNKGQGYSGEFERANLNLSLVEAQMTLLNSWKFFAIDHCSDFMPDREVQRSMAQVTKACLEANDNHVPSGAIFDRIQQVRVDFAQALLQRLVQVNSRGSEVFGLLGVAWKALRARHLTYEAALAHNDTEHYRSLLNVLFLALQFHLDGPDRTPPAGRSPHAISYDLDIVPEIVNVVVAQGFKSLTSYLHEDPGKCTPKDFAILIAILQTCLQVKDAYKLNESISYSIQNNNTARHALGLFSWADRFAIGNDPVYGELSVSILVKLSTVPMLAEYLATESVLMGLSTCRLTKALRHPKGFGPFDATPRLYTIWTDGFLPLCLSILFSVVQAAPEVPAFLNQFEGQLARASEVFSGRVNHSSAYSSEWITLSMASEAYSLSLIALILDQYRAAGPSAGLDPQSIQQLKWDRASVKQDIEDLLEHRVALRSRIVATNDREMEWSRQKAPEGSEAASRLEGKVVQQMRAALACLGGEEES
ncbi:hypothetical protein N7492_007008 [Penicillium capsulatum]|uniref:Nucleoporin NUP188 n=1 Tax=Penicillium capsulatum TaxID=69766 RepID=A0A9W9I1H2_9EURO|nr:hypothetical protein N7492_007008 [Penicillium capsulatum]KAJ6116841.1 hypothetical protein N7512_006566 [Penicillium capsulatum]